MDRETEEVNPGAPGRGLVPADIEAAIKKTASLENHAEGVAVLAAIANRATAALHQLARAEANARKGQPEWGRWASLVNASRDAVLRTATCRQTANQLAAISTPPPSPGSREGQETDVPPRSLEP
ncbi:MAG TPA: hypothetical protein VNL16_19275 [Chloroflexota bacterium]|nr:hypothetical protein [Chloroflexota bacterium]